MPITDWPEGERPREKLLERGPAALSDAELLALFLHTGVRGKTAVDLARELLADLGGLRGLLEAEASELCARPGVGRAKYALLRAALEVGQRHLEARLARGDALASPEDARRFVTRRLRDALALVDVRVLDHLVVGDGEVASFAERGLL